MKKILFIVGSLRSESFNRQVARATEHMLEGKAEVSYLEYGDLPFMNQDTEYPAPAAVARVRKAVSDADGLWIFSPEYNFSYPGVLKNLLDWLSRPLKLNDYAAGTPMTQKPVTVSNAAGKSGGAGCRAKLLELLEMMRMDVMKEPVTGIALGGDTFATGRVTLTDANLADLKTQAEAFLKKLNA